MKNLAELAFEYIWLLCIPNDDVLDEDYVQDLSENLPSYFSAMSTEEKAAISDVAKEIQGRIAANPNEFRYTEEELSFLNSIAGGQFFDQ